MSDKDIRIVNGYEVVGVTWSNYWPEMGRSSCLVQCGFCGTKTRAYVWSLTGGGKKCPCGAILSRTLARRKIKSKKSK